MSVALTLFLSILTVLGFFGAILGAIFLFVNRGSQKGAPKLALNSAGEGQLGVSVEWNPQQAAAEFYRVVLRVVNPFGIVREARFTYTLDPAQKSSFYQPIELAPLVREFLESKEDKRVLFSLTVLDVQETPLTRDLSLKKLRQIYRGKSEAPKNLEQLQVKQPDAPPTMTLDYSELQERKRKVDRLVAEGKAKEQKKAPATPAAGTGQAQSGSGAAEDKKVETQAAKPQAAAAAPAPRESAAEAKEG